jgi:2-polyprenyl-3-methyl-5-hydroxy-6-metoxy-1,4-benzoquinol methylase
MKINNIKEAANETDIYLLDQIIKQRYQSSETILDAGCGSGRNLHWFYNNGFSVYGIDIDEENIKNIKKEYSNQADNFLLSKVKELAFNDDFFDHIICNAVLHFAENKSDFKAMFSELIRVLKPHGSLFIRVASTFGIEDKLIPVSKGIYTLPDGTTRFLLTKSLLKDIVENPKLILLEPVKTVNVNDLRCMTTLVIQKQ